MTKREDTHSPSNFDPAEYTFAGFVDQHPEEGYQDVEDPRMSQLNLFDGHYQKRGGCDHCGARGLRYVAFFIHEPTQLLVATGTQCAVKLSMASKDQLDAKKRREAHEKRMKLEAFLSEPRNREAYDWLTETVASGNHGGGFYFDLIHKCNRYGSLSEKQVDAALKAKEREEGFASRRLAEAAAVTAEFPSGRQDVEGEIISARVKDSDFGTSYKMLVKLTDGNKVWGTIPETLWEQLHRIDDEYSIDAFRGCQVKFTATFEVSRDDEHFGFFKRPAKAELTVPEEVA